MIGMLGRVDLTCRYMYITKNRRSYKYEYDDPPREEGTEEGLVFGRVRQSAPNEHHASLCI